jgi:hypothetical protein
MKSDLQTAAASITAAHPRNLIEEQLAAIWREVLEVQKIGIRDDFFDLGGTSLDTQRLSIAIKKIFAENSRLRLSYKLQQLNSSLRFSGPIQPLMCRRSWLFGALVHSPHSSAFQEPPATSLP